MKMYKHQSKTSSNQAKGALITLDNLALEIQKILLGKLDAAQKRKLVSGTDHEAVKAIFSNIERIVMSCSEHGLTVGEATKKVFANSSPGMEEIKLFISNQPNEVKLPWSRNDVSGFITTCTNIAQLLEKPLTATQKEATSEETPAPAPSQAK